VSAPLFIVGAGGFGREVFSILQANLDIGALPAVAGFIDDAPSPADAARVVALGTGIVGSVADLVSRTEPFHAVLAIGSPVARRSIARRLSEAPVSFPVLIHPTATLGRENRLSAGVVVAAGACLSTNVEVGIHAHIDQNATVGHDSALGDFSRLNPQACISGSVIIGAGAVVGANATVLPGLHVGDDATVGAGAVVVRDVARATIVKGVPAQ